ncbi:hypothetical protein ACFV9P_27955 [Streptomyces sp. NPDC059892]|uniref:hypothetical protein n=1 Tax=Streptomyces sp. NPDC059892 TaxID=3346989 RepID=UPI003650DAA8
MTQTHNTATAGAPIPGRPARADGRRVIAALTVDFGLNPDGTRIRPPRAKYECALCQQRDGPVHGDQAVTEFAAAIRTEHPARCTARSSA